MEILARFALCLVAAGVLAVGPATAQDWRSPAERPGAQSGDDTTRALIDELRKLIERGERQRLADPWYLRDLSALADRYDWPWRVRILSEDFSDRGPRPPPPWRVTAGEFLIDWRFGMRSLVEPPRRGARSRQSQRQDKGQAVQNLLGALLQQSLGGRQTARGERPAEDAPAEPGYSAVFAEVPITNAFALEIEMTSRVVEGVVDGRFEFGPYQAGGGAPAGYRLVYSANPAEGTPSWELVRLSTRGTKSTLELYDQRLTLEDDQAHTLVWTRDRHGAMAVTVDGRQLFQVTDRSFRDPFDGFAIINGGGDFALRRIVIDGTE